MLKSWLCDHILNTIFFISTVQSTMCKIPDFCWPLNPSSMWLSQYSLVSYMDIIKLAPADYWPALKGPEELFSPAGMLIKTIPANTEYMSPQFPAIHLETIQNARFAEARLRFVKNWKLLWPEEIISLLTKGVPVLQPAVLISVWSCEVP